MFRIFACMMVLTLAACNTTPESSAKKTQSNNSVKGYTWSQDEEGEFLSGCVDSAKVRMTEAAAFTQCKCILTQIKQIYPNMDSAAPALMDVKKVAEFAKNCK